MLVVVKLVINFILKDISGVILKKFYFTNCDHEGKDNTEYNE